MQADALLITFQGQLSGIMESILRSALVEITRLVEGSFLEEVGRGKQQADVLRRRVQVLENRLAERERVKRVRCADCGRAGLKKDSGGRETRTKTGLEAVCVPKLGGVSEGGRRSCERRGVTSGQEDTSAKPDSEKIADGIGAKMEGVIKDEEEKQVCSSARSHAAVPSEPQSHAVRERAGICTSQPEVQSPQRDKLPVNGSSGAAGQDLIKQRSPLRKAKHHVDSSHSQPLLSTGGAPPEVPPTVNQVASNPESVAIKQEVVVVLPPDWGATSASGRVNRGPDVQRTTPPAPAPTEDKHSYPGHCAKESHSTAVTDKNQPKPAEHSSPGTVGPSYPKSPPAPNPSRMLPQFHRVYAGDGTVSSVQTGRTPPHSLAVRAHGHVGGHHMARRPYICSHCGKVFSQLCHLKGHQQIHTGERQFCCNLCGRSFTKLSNLKAHRRVHTGERPYICLDCGKRFTQKCNLKRHQRIHSAHL